jgi:hypothetical protein
VETLFWSDIMMEHALVIAALLPGDELAQLRQQAVGLGQAWSSHLGQLRTGLFDQNNYLGHNSRTLDLIQSTIGFKRQLLQMQDSGHIFSFVFPSFATEVLAEAEHFETTLRQLSSDGRRDLAEAGPFWADNMEAHARLTAHLLDPSEQALIQQAVTTANDWSALKSAPDFAGIAAGLDLIIGFKERLGQGIKSGEVNSIIHPALADHMRREAIKARDEVRFFSGA